ncbi:Uncharacterised protein [Vibrio cholerae]|nr:Uncharacterised protein [Vibrio cholerae]
MPELSILVLMVSVIDSVSICSLVLFLIRSTNTIGRPSRVMAETEPDIIMLSTISAAIFCRSVEPKSTLTVSTACASP